MTAAELAAIRARDANYFGEPIQLCEDRRALLAEVDRLTNALRDAWFTTSSVAARLEDEADDLREAVFVVAEDAP